MIEITYNKKTYDLEFDKETVTMLENRGFDINKVTERPTSQFPILFWGAFLKHNPKIKKGETDLMLGHFKDVPGMVSALIDLYNEPANKMFDEPEEDDPNAGTWTVIK